MTRRRPSQDPKQSQVIVADNDNQKWKKNLLHQKLLGSKRPGRSVKGRDILVSLLVAFCLWLRFGFNTIDVNNHDVKNDIIMDDVGEKTVVKDTSKARASIPTTTMNSSAQTFQRVKDEISTTTNISNTPQVTNVMYNDPRCKLVSDPSYKPDDEFLKYGEKGKLENFALGPCRYLNPQRVTPLDGWVHDIDWYHFRPDTYSQRREECFVQCLNLMGKLSMDITTQHDMLAAAAMMGLQNASRVLVEEHRLDPLYLPPEDNNNDNDNDNDNDDRDGDFRKKIRPNAVQAAIMGGYAEVVKILIQSDVKMVIDGHGRTVKDYVKMAGSPIRPYYAEKVLGITSPPNKPRAPPEEEKETKDDNNNNSTDDGWNSTAYDPYIDPGCDFDVIDTSAKDMSFDTFLNEYYLPGRPVVLRNQVPRAELHSFSKKSWSKLDHFHPTSHFAVGNTAYPTLSGQKRCSHKLTIEELEKDVRCSDMRELHMMHAEHGAHFDEAYAVYGGEPKGGGDPPLRGGFRTLDWFGQKGSWQLFFGSDGSGATIHWHGAAFNILYVGTKEWHVTPPQYRGFSGMPALRVKERINDEPFSLKCTQIPGDLIYIPDHWGHSTINHGFGIGVAAILDMGERFLPGYIGKTKVKDKYKDKISAIGKDTSDKSSKAVTMKMKRKHGKLATKSSKAVTMKMKRKHGKLATNDKENTDIGKDQSEKSIPFFFVHINKTGGTSLISMLAKHCTKEEYVKERWQTDAQAHRSFHSTAHSYIARHGHRVWDDAYSFAVVRHPLARQVSNFFFLLNRCETHPISCTGKRDGRLISTVTVKTSSTEEEKIDAFHEWISKLYQAYPPGNPEHHNFGSHGHGNEEYPTMNATQTSWLVDETGQEIVVKKVFQLEHLNESIEELFEAIPCLAKAKTMSNNNQTPKYPHISKFTKNEITNRIMREVFAVDYANFGYDSS